MKDIARRGRFYLGYVTHRRGLKERPGRHPAILDEELGGWRGGMRRRLKGVIQRSPRHRIYLLAGLLHCGDAVRAARLGGDGAGKEWRYYRCRGCEAGASWRTRWRRSLPAHLGAVLPSDIIERAREELAAAWRCPGRREAPPAPRATTERLSQLYAWGDLSEAEYRSQKAEVERDLAMLPDDDSSCSSTATGI